MSNAHNITTNDGIKLRVIDEGKGQPIILLHGWSQTAEMFRAQIDFLKTNYRVIAYDMRGHGLSEKPEYGYRISRLSKDLFDLTGALELTNFNLLGHSMGCSVIWSYIDLFGTDSISKIILVDQQPFMTGNPLWSDEYKETIGAKMPFGQVYNTINALCGEQGVENSKTFLRGRFTRDFDEKMFTRVFEENLKMPREKAGRLLFNHMTQDWRDVLSRIEVETLIITGLESDKPLKCQQYLCDTIPGAELYIFQKGEKGSHFMFIENPEKFNTIIQAFLSR